MDQKQSNISLKVLQQYLANEQAVVFDEDLDDRRRLLLQRIQPLIQDYLSGKVTKDDFKTQIDSISKTKKGERSEVGDLWGFKGIKGMMLFNLLSTACEINDIDLDEILKPAIRAPKSKEDACEKMQIFYKKVTEIQQLFEDRRKAPSPKSVPYFLSYFWQIQEPAVWPIQYTSLERALENLDIWTKTGDVSKDYGWFFDFLNELKNLYTNKSGRVFDLWGVEHVFYYSYNSQAFMSPVNELSTSSIQDETLSIPIATPLAVSMSTLSKSYIPPIVAILSRLAKQDPELEKICQNEKKKISDVFEERVAIAFEMIGFEVESLGQGHGRVPDGIAICREYHYAIIFDAKSTKDEYRIGTDSRAFIEYIRSVTPRLRKQGIEKIFFTVVSGDFPEKRDKELDRIKLTPGIQDVILLPAEALVHLIEMRLRSHDFDLGPLGLLGIFARGGFIAKQDLEE